MGDLIGLPQVAQILKISRQMAHLKYRLGELQAVAITGTDARPRPLFNRDYIERLANAREKAVKA